MHGLVSAVGSTHLLLAHVMMTTSDSSVALDAVSTDKAALR